MSQLEKAKEMILSEPSDYTYNEARQLLSQLGFKEHQKGKTSGSRVKFFRKTDQKMILLHKPHPGDQMKRGAVRELKKYLLEIGELK